MEYYLGNAWADRFAKAGASMHAIADTVEKKLESDMQGAGMQARFMSWCARKMTTRDALSDRPARLYRVSAPMKPVALTAHEMVVRAPGVFQCRACLGVARTKASLTRFLGTPCEPTAHQRLRASMDPELQQAPPMQSEAVAVALAAADSLSGGGSAEANPSAPPSEAIVELNGHQVLVTPRCMVCTLCGSYQVSSGKVTNCKLSSSACLGPSEHGPTRSRQKYRISAVRVGKDPKTGKVLT